MDRLSLLAKYENPKPMPVTLKDGTVVLMRCMRGDEQDVFEKNVPKDLYERKVYQIAYSLCDASGNWLFTTSPEDLAAINSMNGDVVVDLFHKSLALNRITEQEIDTAKKNSKKNPRSSLS